MTFLTLISLQIYSAMKQKISSIKKSALCSLFFYELIYPQSLLDLQLSNKNFFKLSCSFCVFHPTYQIVEYFHWFRQIKDFKNLDGYPNFLKCVQFSKQLRQKKKQRDLFVVAPKSVRSCLLYKFSFPLLLFVRKITYLLRQQGSSAKNLPISYLM